MFVSWNSGPLDDQRIAVLSKRRFFKVVDVGLFQLEILSSFFPVNENSTITAPVLEIRCRNDIIKAWVCVDSLVVLLNLASEISRSEKFAPPEPKEASVRQSVDSCEDNANSESHASTSTSQEIGNLPKPVEMKMKRMLASAMQEDSPSAGSSAGIPCGREALEEFSPNFSVNQNLLAKALVDTTHSERNRAYSLSTDDEFCMVDEDVIGSGITNATGEPNIKYIGSRNDRTTSNAGITIDPHHFRVPSDWRGDGLAALPTDFPSPIARYLLRDISISIHLFGGSDLSDEPPKERSYSTPEYREGKGKNQVVSPDARGGKYRDHSVCVVLELKKITCIFQQFNKDAPLMSMKLFTIHDITLFDRLTASQIKEMMYQYSSAEQPRRTCAPMLAVRMVESHKNEGKLRVSMLPVKFNIDQDTMEFLDDFFQEVRTRVEIPTEVSAAVAPRPVLEVPATIRSSSETGSVKNSPIYPALGQDTLNMNVLMPEAAPPSPIYDLSYLENRTKSTSPVKRSTRLPVRISTESSSPDLLRATSTEDEVLTDDLHLAGDWSSSSEIRFPDMDHIGPVSEVDKMLMGASMHDSFHPDMMSTGDDKARDDFLVSDDLIDTSGEIDACLNGGDGSTEDDDTSTQMASSSAECRYSCDAMESTRGNTFFKEFIFSPAVSIYVDYHGKNKINVERNGAVFAVLSGIGQLNHTEFILKEIVKSEMDCSVLDVAIDEWMADIKSNLPNVLASCGPISPFVQIGKGVVDLFWLPVVELRKEDGHVVKGIQKGVGSFGLSSAAGVVGMAQTVVGVIQMLAESVSTRSPTICSLLKLSEIVELQQLKQQLQQISAMDCSLLGYRQARDDLELALKVAPKAIIGPFVAGTQIGYQVLGGIRNQLRPYQDERHKWKNDEVPGDSGQH
ncbi:hypothetical protein COOONC_07140 [Cooperia oncophora]